MGRGRVEREPTDVLGGQPRRLLPAFRELTVVVVEPGEHERQGAAEMGEDPPDARVPLEHSREREPGDGQIRVGEEAHPDGERIVVEVGGLGDGGVDVHQQPPVVGRLPERLEPGIVQRHAVDVGEDHGPGHAQLVEGVLQAGQGRVGVLERQGRQGSEAGRVLAAQLGEFLVDRPRQVIRLRRRQEVGAGGGH